MPSRPRARHFSTSYVLEDEYQCWKSSSRREMISKVSPLEDATVRAVKRTRHDFESSLADADISAHDKMLSNADSMHRYVEKIKRAKRRSDYAPRRSFPAIPQQRAHSPAPRRQSPRREQRPSLRHLLEEIIYTQNRGCHHPRDRIAQALKKLSCSPSER